MFGDINQAKINNIPNKILSIVYIAVSKYSKYSSAKPDNLLVQIASSSKCNTTIKHHHHHHHHFTTAQSELAGISS